MSEPIDPELAAVVEHWSALPEEQRTRTVTVTALETLLDMRFGKRTITGGSGAPGQVRTLERVIDERPCEPLRAEDSEHDEAPFRGSGAPLYEGAGWPDFAISSFDDPQRPVSE